MLGIALSPPARAYLKQANLGLKHFLNRFPNEFRVEGPKGCERVIWTGAGRMAMTNSDHYYCGDELSIAAQVAAAAVAGGMPQEQAVAYARQVAAHSGIQ